MLLQGKIVVAAAGAGLASLGTIDSLVVFLVCPKERRRCQQQKKV